VKIRLDVLEEKDGPMLQHGLKGLHQQRLHTPRRTRDRPDPERLAKRFEQFLEAEEASLYLPRT